MGKGYHFMGHLEIPLILYGNVMGVDFSPIAHVFPPLEVSEKL